MIIIFVPNYYVRLVAFTLMGVCQLKNSVSYVWMFDLLETRHKSIACGILNAFDNMTLGLTAVYYMFISRNWIYLQFFMSSVAFLCTLAVLIFVPESPKWHLIKGRKDEAIVNFN
jgi:hypothetical protein